MQFGFMLSGSVIVETVFALNGMGYLAWESITRSDLPTVQAIILIFSLIYLVLTLLADLLNAWLDPRVRVADMQARALPTMQEISAPTPGQLLRRRIFGHRALLIGAVILGLIVFTAVLAPLVAPHDPYAQNLNARLLPPIWHAEGAWSLPWGPTSLAGTI